MRRALLPALLACGLLVGACGTRGEGDSTCTFSCAASLRRVMPDLLAAYGGSAPGTTFVPSYGGSGTLRRQVEAGAPVGGVILASEQDVDRLVASGHVAAASRTVLARNVLVLIGGSSAPRATFRSLADLPADVRIAIGDPRFVPAGRYAKSALQALGTWDALEPRTVPAADVAAVTAYVRRGEVALGIAYATEVVDLPEIAVLDRAEGSWAPSPVVIGGTCTGAEGSQAFAGLLAFLSTPTARGLWERAGFQPP